MFPKGSKTKINKLDYIKLKSFSTVKETTNKMEKQPTEQNKISENYIFNNKLIFKVYKEPIQLNIPKQIIQLKIGRGHEQIFLQRKHTDGQ